MKDLIITRLPPLCNTESLDLQELREQYKLLEGDALQQAKQLADVCAKLHDMNRLAHNLSATLYALFDSYEAGDQAAILLQLKQMSDLRKIFRKKVH